ncbi:MAG TPA: hypothetical protein VF229_02190 [Burkholderiaceae bacterium]
MKSGPAMPVPGRPRIALGAAALMIGSAVNYFGDRLLGVKMELFHGLATFSFPWMLDVFVVPVLVGLIVAWIFGLGGKWLCYFPPLIVRCIAYAQIHYLTGVPQGSSLIPLGWWGFFVILAMESAGIGGVIGEVMIKRTYGRSRPASAPARPGPAAAPDSE